MENTNEKQNATHRYRYIKRNKALNDYSKDQQQHHNTQNTQKANNTKRKNHTTHDTSKI